MRAHNIGFDCLINEAMDRVLWLIVDSEDGQPIASGNWQEVKEYWWHELVKEREVGGYWLMSRKEWNRALEHGKFGRFETPETTPHSPAYQQLAQADNLETQAAMAGY